MKVLPISFSPEMVRALLNGSKTQTRRLASSPLAKAQVGDLLYVRERIWLGMEGKQPWYCHVADYPERPSGMPKGTKHVPAMFMKKWASRLTLVVTERRFQALQDISEADAMAEGMVREGIGWRAWAGMPLRITAWQAYSDCWDSMHGERSWNDVNSDVVVLTFQVHKIHVDDFIKHGGEDAVSGIRERKQTG